jgi:hypothetical protein
MAMLQTLRFNLATTACLYLTAIVLLSLQGSLVSSAVVSLIEVGCLAYYFAPPISSFRVDDPFNGTRTAGIISRIRLLFNKGAPQLEPVDAPSSNRMAASCGLPTILLEVQAFTSPYPPRSRNMGDAKPRHLRRRRRASNPGAVHGIPW